ncbi:uncharacterized protein [Ptychodera flava]|uniref:uncharacterized protein n=1 Tax=Ptychodera flava TaxID=63121 RepID=UPI00396AADED
MKKTEVLPIPPVFEDYYGFNEVKRKKMKSLPLSSMELNSHSQALYSILLKPVMKSSPAWKSMHDNVQQLAECFRTYKVHLEHQAAMQDKYRNLDHPVRTVAENATVEHRSRATYGVKDKYKLLNNDVVAAGILKPVLFDESKHLNECFQNPVQRYRFLQDMQLSVPIDVFRFCPGGSFITTVAVVQVTENRSDAEMLTQAARLITAMKPELKEFHTLAQKRAFREKLSRVTTVLPSIADLIYKELTIDAATAAHPETQQRLRLIFLGEEGLLTDLRHLNAGRPTGTFDVFFDKLAELVDEVKLLQMNAVTM